MERDISKINGKLRSLRKLKRMPRAALPDIQHFLGKIEEILQFLLSYARTRCTEESHEILEKAVLGIARTENLVIRVIVQGHELEVAFAELKELMP